MPVPSRFLELALGVRSRDLGGHLPGILQDLAIGGGKEAVQPGLPVLHGHGELADCHVLGDVEIRVHEPRQLRELRLGQVVLGDHDVERAAASVCFRFFGRSSF